MEIATGMGQMVNAPDGKTHDAPPNWLPQPLLSGHATYIFQCLGFNLPDPWDSDKQFEFPQFLRTKTRWNHSKT